MKYEWFYLKIVIISLGGSFSSVVLAEASSPLVETALLGLIFHLFVGLVHILKLLLHLPGDLFRSICWSCSIVGFCGCLSCAAPDSVSGSFWVWCMGTCSSGLLVLGFSMLSISDSSASLWFSFSLCFWLRCT